MLLLRQKSVLGCAEVTARRGGQFNVSRELAGIVASVLLAIDQGTTGSTCIVFTPEGEELGRAYAEFTQHFPQPGWVEHDASEIVEVTLAVANAALDDAGIASGGLAAIGITNQRETTVVWDRATGRPLAPAIVWQDRRTAQRCDELRAAGHEPRVRELTGLVIDSYFSALKLEWLINNVTEVSDAVNAGTAMFGTIDTWLVWNLTGEHVTDPSNASRTLLFDINTGQWSEELMSLFGIPESLLPRIVPSIGAVADARSELLGGRGAPIAGILGDQQSALFGQACFSPGEVKATYGTGSFILMNAGRAVPAVGDGYLATVAWGIGERLDYALEASMFVAGAAVQWLRDGLGLIESAAQTEAMAASLHGNDGVHFVPALTGLGSPWWDPDARGTITGLTRGTTKAHIVRAALEGIAFQVVDSVDAMVAASGTQFDELRADGGATSNSWLMQFQADVLGVPVAVPEISETTALGAAIAAGVGVGAITIAEAQQSRRLRATFEPHLDASGTAELLAGWHHALAQARLKP